MLLYERVNLIIASPTSSHNAYYPNVSPLAAITKDCSLKLYNSWNRLRQLIVVTQQLFLPILNRAGKLLFSSSGVILKTILLTNKNMSSPFSVSTICVFNISRQLRIIRHLTKYATGKEKRRDNEKENMEGNKFHSGRQTIKHISNKMYYWYKNEFLYKLKILKEYEKSPSFSYFYFSYSMCVETFLYKYIFLLYSQTPSLRPQ